MKVGIKEIALDAQVSTATVSNALNRTRYVSPELEQRIFASAQKLGYYKQNMPSDNQKVVRVGKQSEIAFIVPDVVSTRFSILLSELSAACQNAGYTLSVYLCNSDPKVEKHVIAEVLANRRIAGLFICPIQMNSSHYKKLLAADKPFVCIDREIHDANADCVISNNVQGIRDAMHHLIYDGHERIALLLEDQELTTTHEQRNGYIASLKTHDLEVDDNLILSVPLTDGYESRESIKRFIRKHMPNTGCRQYAYAALPEEH